jgi:diguanylate cyclase (GGDEF)-like protein/PAS domain S-box-containing protein
MNDNEKRIKALEEKLLEIMTINQQLIEEKQQDTNLNYSWTGNLGKWYWYVPTNKVTFNHLKITALGYSESEIPEEVTYQYFTDKLHPDDYEQCMQIMRDHLNGKIPVYDVEYRIKAKDGSYRYYYDRGKITKYDKDNNPVLLAGIVFDITEKKKLEEQLAEQNKLLYTLSFTDGLTKVKNHRALIKILEDTAIDANNNNETFSIALFDLDNFKKVNDTKGHVCGDMVLENIAKIMMESVRKSDTVGRYGGEEFMIIFPNTKKEDAFKITESIRDKIEKYRFPCDVLATISAGVCEYDGTSTIELIRKADTLLYKAKDNGRNRVESL